MRKTLRRLRVYENLLPPLQGVLGRPSKSRLGNPSADTENDLNTSVRKVGRQTTCSLNTQRNRKQGPEQMFVSQRSQQQQAQKRKGGTNPNVHWQMNGQTKCGLCPQRNIIHPWKGMKLGTCYTVDEPWRHDAKWNKPATKGHTLYDFTYRRYLK